MANGDQPLGRQPARHDMLRRMRLHHGLRAAAAGVFGSARHQHLELRRDHVEAFGDVLADPGHLATTARAKGAGGLDHPLDPRQVRRQMPAVARRFAGCLSTDPLQRSLGLFLRGFKHALGQFGIFQGQVELVGRQLLGAFAKPLTLRGAQDIFQPTVGFLDLGQCRLDLGQAGLQLGVLAAEGIGIHNRN